MAWTWLSLAIVTEVAATSLLKVAGETPRVWNVGLVVAGYVVSFAALALALRAGMEVGVAYAVWSAVGTAAIVVIGILAYGESANPWKFAFIGLIVVGVVGLQLSGRTG